MYWRMYSGHNCTNYAAYRMIKAGMPNERPWSGGGNASEWGLQMSRITDQRPSVGAIAWWGRYSNGSGSAGHVAYVERVVSATEIVISEDSWGGTFHWRRITKDSGRWPTGFIHFVDKTITNTTAPRIVGTPQVGTALTATTGRWKPSGEKFSYQWYADGAAITGASRQSFTPTAAQEGARLTVTVTVKRAGYNPATATTAATEPVARGEFTIEAPPTISGDPMVDEVLTAAPARFSPAPTTTLYRWLADGERIDGAAGRTLTLTPAVVGKKIQVTAAARAEGYRNRPARSERVGPVVIGAIAVTQPYAVSGRPRVGEELTVTPGRHAPSDAVPSYQWLRDGAPISGATGTSYSVSGEDLGAQISLRVTLTRRNYAPAVQSVQVPGHVTTSSATAVAALGKPGRAVVKVRVTAPGVTAATGRVTVRVGTREVRAWLTDGRVRVVVRDVVPGHRTVRVSYDGTASIDASRGSTTVRVLR
jgi:surface antigen